MVKELACRNCKCVTQSKVCPGCQSTDLTADWEGIVLVANPDESKVAKTLGISKANGWKLTNAKYALKVT